MKIVIDIPKAIYDQICKEKLDGIMARAIRCGRPLPKGHGRLIDADTLMDALQELFDKRCEEAKFFGNRGAFVTWNDAIYYIKSALTIIEKEGNNG